MGARLARPAARAPAAPVTTTAAARGVVERDLPAHAVAPDLPAGKALDPTTLAALRQPAAVLLPLDGAFDDALEAVKEAVSSNGENDAPMLCWTFVKPEQPAGSKMFLKAALDAQLVIGRSRKQADEMPKDDSVALAQQLYWEVPLSNVSRKHVVVTFVHKKSNDEQAVLLAAHASATNACWVIDPRHKLKWQLMPGGTPLEIECGYGTFNKLPYILEIGQAVSLSFTCQTYHQSRMSRQDSLNDNRTQLLNAGWIPVDENQTSQHVMLSYNWDHQGQALQLKQHLVKAGFTVWMDVEQMHGDMNERMAQAVDKAAVVCALVTEPYKQSNNCRKELSYADVKKKPIVPILLQKGVVLDGWLGLLVAGKLYHDLSSGMSADAISAVVRELVSQGAVQSAH